MTVVLYGSLGSTAEMWEPQASAVPGAVVLEHPGHGRAPLMDGVDLDALARRVLDAVPGRFSYVGLSLGATVGMHVAALAPDRVEKLVLACGSVRYGDPSQWIERAGTVRAEGLEAIVDAVMRRWFTASYPGVARWRAMFLSVDREGYARCCEAIAGWDGADDLSRISAPTLVIAGSEDPTVAPEQARAIAARVAGARLEIIEGAAHLANVEAAATFNGLLQGQL
jgi:3-oxoadipate enol-lactonase